MILFFIFCVKRATIKDMAKLLNTVILTFLSFMATLCWVYYLTHLSQLSLTVSLLMAVAVLCAVLIYNKREKKPRKNIEAFRWQMILDSRYKSVYDMLIYNGYNCMQPEENKIFASKNDVRYCFYMKFQLADLTADDVVTVFRQIRGHADKLVIMTNNAHQSAYGTAKTLSSLMPTTVTDCEQLHVLMQQSRCIPSEQLPKPPKKRPALNYAFNRKRFGAYASASVFIFATGWLTFFPIYSMIWASVLAVFALFSLFNKQFNRPSPSPLD